jgi:hypothetical protein
METTAKTLRILTEEVDGKSRFVPQCLNDFGVWCAIVKDETGFYSLSTKKIQLCTSFGEAKERLKIYLEFRMEREVSYTYFSPEEIL